MLHAIWLSYAAFLFSAILYFFVSSSERSFRWITATQLVYAVCLILATGFPEVVSRNLWLIVVWGILIVALVRRQAAAELGSELQAALEKLQSDFNSCRKALADDRNSLLALHAIAVVYERFGEAALAQKYYARLSELCDSGDTAEEKKLYGQATDKLISLRRMGSECAENPAFPRAFKACSLCEFPVRRDWYSCPKCDKEFFTGKWIWRCALIGRTIEKSALIGVTGAGIAFLPYLFNCGSSLYNVLWGLWILILVTTKSDFRPVGVDSFKDLKPVLSQIVLFAVLLSGFGVFAVRAAEREQEYAANLSFSRPNPTLERVIDDLRQGKQNIELQETLTDAELTGKLDTVISDGVTYREVLKESREGYVGTGWAKILAGIKRRERLARLRLAEKFSRKKTALVKSSPPADTPSL